MESDTTDHVCSQCGAPLKLRPGELDHEVRCSVCGTDVAVLSEDGARTHSIKVGGIHASALRRCALCNKHIQKADKFCPHCGVLLDSIHTHEPLLNGKSRRVVVVAQPIKTGATMFVVGCVLLLIAFTVSLLYYRQKLKELDKAPVATRREARRLRQRVVEENLAKEAATAEEEKVAEGTPAKPKDAGATEEPETAKPETAETEEPSGEEIAVAPAPEPKPPATQPAVVEKPPESPPVVAPITPPKGDLMDFLRRYVAVGLKGNRAEALAFLSASSRALAEKEPGLSTHPFRLAGGVPYWEPFAGHAPVPIEKSFSVIDSVREDALVAEVLAVDMIDSDRARIIISHPEAVRVEKNGVTGVYRDVYTLPFVKEEGVWRLDLTEFYEMELLAVKQRKAMAVARRPDTIKLEPDKLWVSSVPQGALVYVGRVDTARKVRDRYYGFPVERLFQGKNFLVGRTPVSVPLKEGRYRVAVMLDGNERDRVFLSTATGYIESGEEDYNRPGSKDPMVWDGGAIRLIALRGKVAMLGKVYEVAKEAGKGASLIGFLKRTNESYEELIEKLPKEASFEVPVDEVEKSLSEWQGGLLTSELSRITEILARGGAFAFTGPDADSLVLRMVDFDKIKVEAIASE